MSDRAFTRDLYRVNPERFVDLNDNEPVVFTRHGVPDKVLVDFELWQSLRDHALPRRDEWNRERHLRLKLASVARTLLARVVHEVKDGAAWPEVDALRNELREAESR